MENSILKFSLLGLILWFTFGSCQKNENSNLLLNDLQKNEVKNITTANLEDALNKINEFDVSQDYDAMVFYTGYALNKVLSSDVRLRQNFSKLKIGKNGFALSAFLEKNPEVRSSMNSEIVKLLRDNSFYNDFKARTLRNNIPDGFDYISSFEKAIKKTNKNDILLLYAPTSDKTFTDFRFGLDITTPNKNLVLTLNDEKKKFQSEKEIKNSLIKTIMLGIYAKEDVSKWDYFLEKKSTKWYHYMKVTLHEDHPISVKWGHKYRWYSKWKTDWTHNLFIAGDYTQRQYSGYRMVALVYFNHHGTDHYFKIWEKHYVENDWDQIY